MFSIRLDSIQDLLFILVSTHLAWRNKGRGKKDEGGKPASEGNSEGRSERSKGATCICPSSRIRPMMGAKMFESLLGPE